MNILTILIAAYLLWTAAYLAYERRCRKKQKQREREILPPKTAEARDILGKSSFSLSHSTPQVPAKEENEKPVNEENNFAEETEKHPKVIPAEELDALFAEDAPLPEEVELMDDMGEPMEYGEAQEEDPVDEEETLAGCSPKASGIRFEDMGLAVRVAVSGHAADEAERLQAGRTLAELRGTPMLDQLTAGDAERERRIAELIDLHLAEYGRKRTRSPRKTAGNVPADFSIDDIV